MCCGGESSLCGSGGYGTFLRWFRRIFYTLAIVNGVLAHIFYFGVLSLSEEEFVAKSEILELDPIWLHDLFFSFCFH